MAGKRGRPRKVVKQMGPGVEALPPAGDAKRDELKRRADALAAAQEILTKDVESLGDMTGSIDPDKLDPKKVEREIRQVTDFETGNVPVSKAQPGYVYRWEYRDPSNRTGGRYIHARKQEGWEVVTGDMPEAKEHLAVTSERWVADCLLLRITKEHHEVLRQRDRMKRLRRHEGITGNVRDMASKHGVRVIDYSQPSPDVQRLVKPVTRVPSQGEMRREWARGVAKEAFDKALKEGALAVPGDHNRR